MPKNNQWIDFALVKREADFEQILRACGIQEIRRSGAAQLKALCPFHEDAKPSLSINTKSNLFHCFGCGARGDVIDFMARHDESSKPAAARRIVEICNISTAEGQEASPKRRRERKGAEGTTGAKGTPTASQETPERQGEQELEEFINPPLTFTLKLDPEHPYLEERGLLRKTIETFGLGYCSRGMMKGRVCIPIHNEEGVLVAYAGRWVGSDDTLPEGENKYKLPPKFKKSRILFNLNRVGNSEHLVIVEGYFAVLRLYELGVPAIALMGRDLSPEQEALLLGSGARHLTLMLDGDKPGRTATAEILPRLARHRFVRLVALPEGEQPDTVDEELLEGLFA